MFDGEGEDVIEVKALWCFGVVFIYHGPAFVIVALNMFAILNWISALLNCIAYCCGGPSCLLIVIVGSVMHLFLWVVLNSNTKISLSRRTSTYALIVLPTIYV